MKWDQWSHPSPQRTLLNISCPFLGDSALWVTEHHLKQWQRDSYSPLGSLQQHWKSGGNVVHIHATIISIHPSTASIRAEEEATCTSSLLGSQAEHVAAWRLGTVWGWLHNHKTTQEWFFLISYFLYSSKKVVCGIAPASPHPLQVPCEGGGGCGTPWVIACLSFHTQASYVSSARFLMVNNGNVAFGDLSCSQVSK